MPMAASVYLPVSTSQCTNLPLRGVKVGLEAGQKLDAGQQLGWICASSPLVSMQAHPEPILPQRLSHQPEQK
ncbi:hypothetical protein KL918_005155 [Ogataea parapolymorpha]|nr:hypothetical protein KL918_005155 [Ogataea parapolymorpha]KAG7873338.1 hypothetical protein KL916_002287 [Ogataea parapolymorpha]